MCKYRYFLFKGKHLSRSLNLVDFEWFEHEKWVKNETRSIFLMDCMMDYGDADPFDYDEITENDACKLIGERTDIIHR